MRRFVRCGLLVFALMLCLPALASAHAYLEKSVPLQNAELKESPTEIRIKFTENIDVNLCQIRLENEKGQLINGELTAEDHIWLVYKVPTLENGIYKVNWQVLSVDTHVTEGSFRFSVGVPLTQSGPSETVSLDETDSAERPPAGEKTQPGSKPPEQAKPNPSANPTSGSQKPAEATAQPDKNDPPEEKPAPTRTPESAEEGFAASSRSDGEGQSLGATDSMATQTSAGSDSSEPEQVTLTEEETGEGQQGIEDYENQSRTETAETENPHEHVLSPVSFDHDHDGMGGGSALQKTLRVLELFTVVALVGFLFVRYIMWGSSPAAVPLLFSLRNERILVLLGVAVFTVSGILRVWTLVAQFGTGLSSQWELAHTILSSTLLGDAVLLRLTIVALLIPLTFAPEQDQRWAFWMKATGALALVVTFPLTGHAYASSSGVVYAVILHALHMLTGGIWFGGLVGLFAATFRESSSAMTLVHLNEKIRRFSMIALPLIVLVAMSGVLLSFKRLSVWSDLFTSHYGQLIVIKSAILLLVFVIAAFHRLLFMPRIHEAAQSGLSAEPKAVRKLVNGIRWEIILAGVTLVLAGMLATTSPPQGELTAQSLDWHVIYFIPFSYFHG